MSNPHLLMDEDFREDCRTADLPDLPDEVSCEACGATIFKDDAERIDDGAGRKGYYYLCAECADGVRHYQAVSK